MPYEENVAAKLEEDFKSAFETNQWHKEVVLANKETIVFHGPDVLVLFPPPQSPDAWGNQPVSIFLPIQDMWIRNTLQRKILILVYSLGTLGQCMYVYKFL